MKNLLNKKKRRMKQRKNKNLNKFGFANYLDSQHAWILF